MPYVPPYIDETGLHTNTYPDILEHLISSTKAIYGSNIYLEPDSQDYQFISIFARAIYEEEQCARLNYQARSPVTTTSDDALDGLVTLNGLKRKSASYSTVNVTLTGEPYTLVVGGVVQSIAGDKWNLPQRVVIGANGIATAVATAQEIGSITASPNTVTQIITPTYGWYTVTNEYQASPGQPVETLSQLKARQQASVALPSQTPKEGIGAALFNVDSVTEFVVYENDAGAELPYDTLTKLGGPAHSITCVVEGGDDNEIAKAIDLKKTPGCYIAGNILIPVIDNFGSQNNIRFYRPKNELTQSTFYIRALPGYSNAVGEEIKQAVVDYVQKLGIGNNLYISQLWEAALSVSPDIRPYFSLTNVTQDLAAPEAPAKGTITLLSNLSQGDTITIGSTVLTAGTSYTIGATASDTAAAIAELEVPDVTLSATGSIISITASNSGISGNTIALATSNPNKVLLSGSTLSGGSDGPEESAKDLVADFNTQFYTSIYNINLEVS